MVFGNENIAEFSDRCYGESVSSHCSIILGHVSSLKSSGDTKFALPKRSLLSLNYISKLNCAFLGFYFYQFSCPAFVVQYNRWPHICG